MAARYNTSAVVSITDYLYINEDQIDPELKCAICHQPFVNPKVGKHCGHTFCDICVTNWSKKNSSCPTCRQATTFRALTTRIVLSQLDRLLVRCQQCNQSNIQRGDFADHIEYRCRQVIVKCEAADMKCSWTGNREQRIQHSAICPLLQVRPVVGELKAELSALAYQLQMFMDEVRDQLSYLQQQSLPPAQAKPSSQKKNDGNTSEKERFDRLNNDLRHTWTKRYCFDPCNFCHNAPTENFVCLVCSRPAARAHIYAHDFSGSVNDVICRFCIEKYGRDMIFILH